VESAREGMHDAADMVRLTWKALAGLLTREIAADNVGGPIMIAQTIYDQADHGLVNVLVIAALISVNLGILNLLPVPVLDGGHLVFLLVEMISRRAVPPKVQEKAMAVGIMMLIALMVFATFNDVMRIVNGFIGS
jgi:regulator of sigma E protease